MKKIALILLLSLMLSGCATENPIQKKYQDLDVLYKSGQLSKDEYEIAKQKIMREEMAHADAMAQADKQEERANRGVGNKRN